ncbi:unnamed protein product [Miscanthus lutarioriparius]|uniref:Uncharacterized protein n=1 Tax=Miscanthus lutarioriparius TaxID=422564 RepID=A0A811MJD6_9POAL|nr:unnamed protein product [Miscanthus lutarioriparius]
MESAIRDHLLWANATNQEIDHALKLNAAKVEAVGPGNTICCRSQQPHQLRIRSVIYLILANSASSKIIKELEHKVQVLQSADRGYDTLSTVDNAAADEDDLPEADDFDPTEVFTMEDFLEEDEIVEEFVRKIGDGFKADIQGGTSSVTRRRRQSGPRRRVDATGMDGHSPLQKYTAAIQMLACGSPADQLDERLLVSCFDEHKSAAETRTSAQAMGDFILKLCQSQLTNLTSKALDGRPTKLASAMCLASSGCALPRRRGRTLPRRRGCGPPRS